MGANEANAGGEAARIADALARVAGETDPLRAVEALRKVLGPELARRAAEALALERRARRKFAGAPPSALERGALEQASRGAVARARAARFRALAPGALVYDATCGLGADAAALIEAGMRVVCGDIDRRRVELARTNLAARGLESTCVVADARSRCVSARWLCIDPDRRASGARTKDPSRWSPTLAESLALAADCEGACIKLPAAIDIGLIGSLAPPELRSLPQWVGCGGEACELALWTGALAAGSEPGAREALVLARDGAELGRIVGVPSALGSQPGGIVSTIRWLADPEPAVVLAGLVGALGERLGLRALGPRCAYLGGADEPPATGLASVWRVLATSSADPRRVRAMLTALDVGQVQVLKRGHPDPAEVLERRMRGRGSRAGHLAIARLDRGHVAFALERRESAPHRVGDEGIEPPASSL